MNPTPMHMRLLNLPTHYLPICSGPYCTASIFRENAKLPGPKQKMAVLIPMLRVRKQPTLVGPARYCPKP